MKSKMILIVLLCSMIPIIELRGAIPLGAGISEIEWVSEIFNISAGDTLPWWQNYIISVIGNMLPVPFILVNYDPAYTLREGGCLADIVPTLIETMGKEQPAEMTGKDLIK